MQLSDIDYHLPAELIAQVPIEPRDSARLLVDQGSDAPRDAIVRDLPQFLRDGDVLVVNDTKVVPARLHLSRSSGEPSRSCCLNRWMTHTKRGKHCCDPDAR